MADVKEGAKVPGQRAMSNESRNAPDVSIIIPSYRGESRITKVLDSIEKQTVLHSRFEVVLVLNGDPDDTPAVVEEWHRRNRTVQLQIHETPVASAANARNIGINKSLGNYVTFVDDDDAIGKFFLRDLLAHASVGRITVAPIYDVDENTLAVKTATYLNNATFQRLGDVVKLDSMPTLAAANAAKLVHSTIARSIQYDSELKSGEDIDFWARAFSYHGLKAYIVDPSVDNGYLRVVRSESVSRQSSSWDFSVVQRVSVMRKLEQTASDCPGSAGALRALIRAQSLHIARFLKEQPELHAEVIDLLRRSGIGDDAVGLLHYFLPKALVVSYAFPPTNDTSGLVMARRVETWRKTVDVVSTRMDNIRSEERSSIAVGAKWIAKHCRLAGPGVFQGWKGIRDFTAGVDRFVQSRLLEISPYDCIYSRAMWPAAHIAAAVQKIRRPEIPWHAEFSDPILYDVAGKERLHELEVDPLVVEILDGLRRAGLPLPDNLNLFGLIEHLVYALADQVIFTNENQRNYMLGYLPSKFSRDAILDRSIVAHQPTLDSTFYNMVNARLRRVPGRIHIGYFGVFYATRGVGQLLDALTASSNTVRNRVVLDIYTDKPVETRELVKLQHLEDTVRVHRYVPYLKFLNLTTKFDWLLVFDSESLGTHDGNPYLPSKLSDYLGSGSRVWAMAEPGSVLSRAQVDIVSTLGDMAETQSILEMLSTTDGYPNQTITDHELGGSGQ